MLRAARCCSLSRLAPARLAIQFPSLWRTKRPWSAWAPRRSAIGAISSRPTPTPWSRRNGRKFAPIGPQIARQGRATGRQHARHLRRRLRRRVWRGRVERLDRERQASGVRRRHRRQHRRADRALRLLGAALRPRAESGLHHIEHRRYRHRPTGQRPDRRRCALQQRAARRRHRLLRDRGLYEGGCRRASQRPPPPDRHHQSRRRSAR